MSTQLQWLAENNKKKQTPFPYLSGRKSVLLSMFSGSVMSGRKAAPPSAPDTTNFTADQTAMF